MITRQEITSRLIEHHGICRYDDSTHIYTLSGKKIPSVTTMKKDLSDPFDPSIRKKFAIKHQMTEAKVQALWDGVKDAGTMIHELLEACLFDGHICRPTNHLKFGKEAHARLELLKRKGVPAAMLAAFKRLGLRPVAAELTLWCGTAGGTADLIAEDSEGVLHVVDWKTNAKGGFGQEFPWDKSLKAPFGHLTSTKLNEFSIQLSSYAAMLKNVGYAVGESFVIHGSVDEDEKLICDVYKCKDLVAQCEKWLGMGPAMIPTIVDDETPELCLADEVAEIEDEAAWTMPADWGEATAGVIDAE